MSAYIEMSGRVYGKLTVVSQSERTASGNRRWACRCECGNETVAHGAHLRSGHTLSCGCFGFAKTSRRNTTHGLSRSPEYSVWAAMIGRCNRPNDGSYANYGGRGITVDPTWLSFLNFYADVGPRPTQKHELDRTNNDKGYCKDNVRWVTKDINLRNQRKTVLLTFNGQIFCQKDAAVASGISEAVLIRRRAKGLTTENDLFAPVKRRKQL